MRACQQRLRHRQAAPGCRSCRRSWVGCSSCSCRAMRARPAHVDSMVPARCPNARIRMWACPLHCMCACLRAAQSGVRVVHAPLTTDEDDDEDDEDWEEVMATLHSPWRADEPSDGARACSRHARGPCAHGCSAAAASPPQRARTSLPPPLVQVVADDVMSPSNLVTSAPPSIILPPPLPAEGAAAAAAAAPSPLQQHEGGVEAGFVRLTSREQLTELRASWPELLVLDVRTSAEFEQG